MHGLLEQNVDVNCKKYIIISYVPVVSRQYVLLYGETTNETFDLTISEGVLVAKGLRVNHQLTVSSDPCSQTLEMSNEALQDTKQKVMNFNFQILRLFCTV